MRSFIVPNNTGVIKLRRKKWVGHVECMEKRKNAYRILVAKPQGVRPPERSGAIWENSINLYHPCVMAYVLAYC
jgi:hypothetical protein